MTGKEGEAPYWEAIQDGERVAGIFTSRSPEFDGMPSHWFTYFGVDDIHDCLDANKAAGGRAFREPFEFPNVGTIAVVRDSTGAGFAMMHAGHLTVRIQTKKTAGRCYARRFS